MAFVAAALAGCGARGEPAPGNPAPEDTTGLRLADSLVLSAPGGFTVWFTEGRKGTSASGAPCIERTLEIRRDTLRHKIPLLYTVTVPRLLDDTTLRAELARDCAPAAAYRVDLRDAMPHRIAP
jgi:hypothetical protein